MVAPEMRDLDSLSRDLAMWLSPRMEDCLDLRIANLAYPQGAGMSHETILFDAIWQDCAGSKRSRSLVVRIKPTRHLVYQDDMFDEQFRLMQVMHDSGKVRVAKPLWFESNPTLLGAPFFVMERVAGRVAVSFPPYSQEGWLFNATPSNRRKMWEDGVRQLAAIQRVPLASVGFLSIPGQPEGGFEQEWDRWSRYLTWIEQRRTLTFLHVARAQLEKTAPLARIEGIVWGDARLGNMMIDTAFNVAAVMDWEQPSLGGALHDLGWWLFTDTLQTSAKGLPPLAGMGSRDETIALWEECAALKATELDWYEAFAAFKMSCLSARMLDLKGNVAPGQDYADNLASRLLADMLGLSRPAPQPS